MDSAQTRKIGRIDGGLAAIEALAKLAHEIDAALQRVEIERCALLGIRANNVEPHADVSKIAPVRPQGHTDERDQQQGVAETHIVDVDNAGQTPFVHDHVLSRDVVQERCRSDAIEITEPGRGPLDRIDHAFPNNAGRANARAAAGQGRRHHAAPRPMRKRPMRARRVPESPTRGKPHDDTLHRSELFGERAQLVLREMAEDEAEVVAGQPLEQQHRVGKTLHAEIHMQQFRQRHADGPQQIRPDHGAARSADLLRAREARDDTAAARGFDIEGEMLITRRKSCDEARRIAEHRLNGFGRILRRWIVRSP